MPSLRQTNAVAGDYHRRAALERCIRNEQQCHQCKTHNAKIGKYWNSSAPPYSASGEKENPRARIHRALISAGCRPCHEAPARRVKFAEVRLNTGLNVAAAPFYVCTDRPDVAAACLRNHCSPDQHGLARRREVL